MKCNVCSSDFERYIIPLPVGARVGKKRKSYIRAQLEKCHPCFSDSCCYDTRYNFSGKGIVADAVVMDKVVLSRYRSQFPRKALTVKVNTHSRRIFQQTSLVVPAVITPIALSALIFSIFQPQQVTDVVTEMPPDTVIIQEKPKTEPAPSALLGDLFAAIKEADKDTKSIISRFEFSMQNRKESISMEISGIYPESLRQIKSDRISFSPVVYHEGTPSFTVSLVSRHSAPEIEQTVVFKSQNERGTEIVVTLRKIITESGGTMIQESTEQGEVKFQLPKASFKSFMEKLEDIFVKSKTSIKGFSLTDQGGSKNGDFSASIYIDIDELDGTFSFMPFTEYSELFTKTLLKQQTTTKIEKETKSIYSSYSKIGEIQEGGKKWVFYRTPEGKIVRIEE